MLRAEALAQRLDHPSVWGLLEGTRMMVANNEGRWADSAQSAERALAILGEQSVIRQFDTPERILAYPVDDFVSDFIGSGSTLKGLNFERVRDLQLSDNWPIVSVDTDRADAQRLYDASPEKWMLVLDADQRAARLRREHHR